MFVSLLESSMIEDSLMRYKFSKGNSSLEILSLICENSSLINSTFLLTTFTVSAASCKFSYQILIYLPFEQVNIVINMTIVARKTISFLFPHNIPISEASITVNYCIVYVLKVFEFYVLRKSHFHNKNLKTLNINCLGCQTKHLLFFRNCITLQL